jgi:hypothetical protein
MFYLHYQIFNLYNVLKISLFTVQYLSDPTLSTLSNATLQSIVAFIQFTNLDSCTNHSTMPDEVQYTLRMQEYVTNFVTLVFMIYLL